MRFRLLLCVLLVVLPAAAARAVGEERPRQVAAALARAGTDGELGVLEAARALGKLGPAALPELVLALGAERGDTRGPRARALLAALAAAGPEGLRQAATQVGASPLGLHGALVALGELGTVRDAKLAAELASRAAERGELDAPRARALERALGALCARERGGAALCGDLIEPSHPLVRERIVLALATAHCERSLEALSRGLGYQTELDRLVLAELARNARVLGRGASARTLERVRPMLAHADARLAGDAALALGRLGDASAAGELVALLRRQEDELVRKAHHALVALTGLGLRAEPARWESWYRGEERWWREQAPHFIERLTHPGQGGASEAVLELGRRRLHRDEAAAVLVRVLSREEPELVALVCATLGRLGSSHPLPALVDCLDHRDEGVRVAACKALRALTGRELPPEVEAWRAVLPG